jgi:hypothetical protein
MLGVGEQRVVDLFRGQLLHARLEHPEERARLGARADFLSRSPLHHFLRPAF